MQWEAMKLNQMVADALPTDHPMHRHVQQSVGVVRDNAGWSWPEKFRFAHKLINQSKRLERRSSA